MIFIRLNLIKSSVSLQKLDFIGAKYEKNRTEQDDLVQFACKNHRQTRRNSDRCEGLLVFGMINRNVNVLVDRLTNYTLHSVL